MRLIIFTLLTGFVLSSHAQVVTQEINVFHPIDVGDSTNCQTSSNLPYCYSTQLALANENHTDFMANTGLQCCFFWIIDVRFNSTDTSFAFSGFNYSYGEVHHDTIHQDTILLQEDYLMPLNLNVTDTSYIGLIKFSGTDTLYGWLSYKFHYNMSNSRYYVHFIKTAMNSIPNMPLPAGHDCYALLDNDTLTACDGDTLLINATGGIDFQWNTGFKESELSYIASKDTTLYVVAKGSGQCVDTASVFIQVTTDPIADFSFSIHADTVWFENLSQNAHQFFWEFGDQMTSDDIEPVHLYDLDSVYTVCLWVTNDCGIDSLCSEIDIQYTSVENSQTSLFSEQLTAYPNPAGDVLQIRLNSQHLSMQQITVNDLNSRTIHKETLNSTTHTSFNIKHLPQGLYFYRVELSDGKVLRGKFVKR